jgi:hypothetical protein
LNEPRNRAAFSLAHLSLLAVRAQPEKLKFVGHVFEAVGGGNA